MLALSKFVSRSKDDVYQLITTAARQRAEFDTMIPRHYISSRADDAS
jgi:hypothetical protein